MNCFQNIFIIVFVAGCYRHVTTNFRDDFLTNYKLDSVGILWAGSYGPNTSAHQKSEPSDAWISRYKRNGWK
jgi:hypothetical protein